MPDKCILGHKFNNNSLRMNVITASEKDYSYYKLASWIIVWERMHQQAGEDTSFIMNRVF